MRKKTVPKYRRQLDSKGSRAFVELAGVRHYLGPYGSSESRERYARIIAEWESNGHQPAVAKDEITVMELCAHFWDFAQGYYRHQDGSPTRELANYRSTLKPLKELYGEIRALDFGPRALKAIREKWIAIGLTRKHVNQLAGRIKRVFRWGVSEELISPTVYQALQAIPGLKRGRCEARESQPVEPAPLEHVEAVKPYVSEEIWALVQLQLLTGARSGELVILRPRDIQMTGQVWTYTPSDHKTSYREHSRTIYLGPKAQEILRPFLLRGAEAFCFSPKEAEERRRAQVHEERETPLSCGNSPGTNRSRYPKRPPRDRYDVGSYGHAITRACKKAGVAHWHPHQLRHASATYLRREFGLDVARVVLGHRSLGVSDTYAELDRGKALEVMARIG